jgi:uncharacterized protein (TIRG00374 family)
LNENEETLSEDKQSKKNTLFAIIKFLIKLAIACGIIGYMVHKNYDLLMTSLKGIHLKWFIIAMCFYLAHLVAAAFRWYALLRIQHVDISFREAFSLTMQGFFFSLIMVVGGAIGGDVVKATFIAKRVPADRKVEGVFSILMDRIVGMIALFSLTILIGLNNIELLQKLNGMILLLFLACGLGLMAVVLLIAHRQFEKIPIALKVMNIVDEKTKGMLTRMKDVLDHYKRYYKKIILLVAFSVVFIHLMLPGAVYCLGASLGGEPLPIQKTTLAVAMGNTAGLIPLTASGIGTRDTVIKNILIHSDVPEGKAIAIPLLFTVIILLFNAIGGLFYVFETKKEDVLACKTL